MTAATASGLGGRPSQGGSGRKARDPQIASKPLSRDNVNRRIRGVTKRPWRWASDGSLRGSDGNAVVFPRLCEDDTLRDLVNRDADADFLIRAVNAYQGDDDADS